MWAYAAEHQPDGNLAEYSSAELAELLGCNEYATSMLEALKKCGFVDESGMIHDWKEHNSYHEMFAKRAKLAAEARWAKEKSPIPPKPKETGNRTVDSGASIAQAWLKHTPSITEDDIYREYPKKVGKPDALKAIKRAMSKCDPIRLLELTKAYAARRNGDLSFMPNPSTWFNQERFNDDPTTWERSDNTNEKPPKSLLLKIAESL